ncbi:uncharacterized protein CDV56_105284 [Aspergillus thermomutatus]|uniref:Uncharacterized protein n=1 Tax=Aspergillus thermomutatus TaxID=41047 RepID=A0A397GQN1_ASPTH|nr:uncharacterized protein CDV56_105284 [Aspergillus thermomutatus]RHZ53115.1 hypothetical protein CDV56_105284 [Aspergillus thermomutatus]
MIEGSAPATNLEQYLNTPDEAIVNAHVVLIQELINRGGRQVLNALSPARDLCRSSTPTPSPVCRRCGAVQEDQSGSVHTQGSFPIKATEEKVKKLKQVREQKGPLAATNEYSIWFFLPQSCQVKLNLSKIEKPPPVVPKFAQPTMPMLPAGIITGMPHNWDDNEFWVRFNHTTAFLKFRTSSPWVQVCDSSGKPLKTTQWELTTEFQSKKSQLKAAKIAMENLLGDLPKLQQDINLQMIQWRVDRRNWEAELDAGPSRRPRRSELGLAIHRSHRQVHRHYRMTSSK